MSWAEVKKINDDMTTPLDELLKQQTQKLNINTRSVNWGKAKAQGQTMTLDLSGDTEEAQA